MRLFPFVILLALFANQCRPKPDSTTTEFPGKPAVPSSIKAEHEYLLGLIHEITLFKDSTGRVAQRLEVVMKHHFTEEEDFVLPPLGLLPFLAHGELPEQSIEVIQLTEKLKLQLTHITTEHQLINAHLNELKQAAATENHPGIKVFEKELHKHATIEEEVLFPTVILIGEYLKIKSAEPK